MNLKKIRQLNLKIAQGWVPALMWSGCFILWLNFGVFAAVCGVFLTATVGKGILEAIKIAENDLH